MKRFAVFVLACVAGGQVLLGQPARRPSRPAPSAPAAPAAPATAKQGEVRVPFRPGELLTYDVSYSSYVTAGTVTMQVQAKRPSYNSVAYYVVAEARPAPLLSKVYTLYYKADVLMDVYTLLPQRAGVYSEEGERHQMKVTTFNNSTRKATFENVTAKNGKREFAVPAFTQDALSAVYVMRSLPLKVGGKETIPVSTGGRSYRAQVSVVGMDAVQTPAGPFRAFRLRTMLYDDAGQPNGRAIQLWISDTPSRVPVQVQSELAVGAFHLTLRDAKLGQ